MEHRMTHKVAFLDVMDAKVQAEIQSALPPGFSIQYAESGDRRELMAMVADADFILTAVSSIWMPHVPRVCRWRSPAVPMPARCPSTP